MAHRHPPLVPGLPLVGNGVRFLRDPVAVLQEGHRRYGRVFSVRLGPKRAVVLIGPEHHRAFFTATDHALSMREVYRFVIPMFGEVSMAADPVVYRHHRAFVEAALRSADHDSHVDAMVSEVSRWLRSLPAAGRFDVRDVFETLSMRIAARALLGDDLACQLGDRFWSHYRDVANGMQVVLPPNLPLPKHLRRDRARRALFAALRPVIRERRAHPREDTGVLQALAQAAYPDGSPVADEDIVGLILILVFAAYETTAAQVSWVLILLLQHPRWLHRVVDEQRAVLGTTRSLSRPTLGRLPQLQRAVLEGERLRPVTTMLWRHVAEPFRVDGYEVPAGWAAIVAPPVAHRLPEVFHDPDTFDPDRFDPRAGRPPSPFAVIDFGGGFHKCLGVHFARAEMQVILSLLLAHYELELCTSHPRGDTSTGLTKPAAGITVAYRRRAGDDGASADLLIARRADPIRSAHPRTNSKHREDEPAARSLH